MREESKSSIILNYRYSLSKIHEFLFLDESSCHELDLFFRSRSAAHPCNPEILHLPLNRQSKKKLMNKLSSAV